MTEVSELPEYKGEGPPGRGYRRAVPLDENAQAARRLHSPWDLGGFYFQPPHHMIAFQVDVVPNCEPMNIGVCAFPPFVFPKRQVGADGRLRKPAWSLAVTDAGHYPMSLGS